MRASSRPHRLSRPHGRQWDPWCRAAPITLLAQRGPGATRDGLPPRNALPQRAPMVMMAPKSRVPTPPSVAMVSAAHLRGPPDLIVEEVGSDLRVSGAPDLVSEQIGGSALSGSGRHAKRTHHLGFSVGPLWPSGGAAVRNLRRRAPPPFRDLRWPHPTSEASAPHPYTGHGVAARAAGTNMVPAAMWPAICVLPRTAKKQRAGFCSGAPPRLRHHLPTALHPPRRRDGVPGALPSSGRAAPAALPAIRRPTTFPSTCTRALPLANFRADVRPCDWGAEGQTSPSWGISSSG